MRVALYVLLTASVAWTVLTIVILAVDRAVSKRYDDMLELRDWTEKVEAMRRMHDREGDA
jgi:hypothetical protein